MSYKCNETVYSQFSEATNLFNQVLSNPDDTSILKKLKEISKINIWAKIRLAECKLNGIVGGTKNDVKNALKTLDDLAKQRVIFAKFKKAQYILGCKESTKKARKAAKETLLNLPEQFKADVQYILGCYYYEKGKKKKAKKFLENAAEVGSEIAKNKLNDLNEKHKDD